MRKFLGVSAAALLVASCGGPDAEGTFETEDGGTGTYSVDADGDETNIEITGEDGASLSISAGENASADLPGGFSIFPGATVVSNANINQDDGSLAIVQMQSSDSPDAMIDFYRQQAEAAGVNIEMEMTANGNSVIAGESEGGTSFSFSASPNGDGTTGQLTIGQGMD